VSLHWGIEHVTWPSPEQIAVARRLIEAGASIVWGHHPHVVQPIERHGDGLIAYSLGNFNFWHSDVENSEATRRGGLLSVDLANERVADFAVTGTRIDDAYVPEPVEAPKSTLPAMPPAAASTEQAWRLWYEAVAPTYLRNHWRSAWRGVRLYGLAGTVDLARWLRQPLTRRCIWTQLRRRFRRAASPPKPPRDS
jgi:poly-gamma-glutamate synthesis protein (capsule biosynthesis protein)